MFYFPEDLREQGQKLVDRRATGVCRINHLSEAKEGTRTQHTATLFEQWRPDFSLEGSCEKAVDTKQGSHLPYSSSEPCVRLSMHTAPRLHGPLSFRYLSFQCCRDRPT